MKQRTNDWRKANLERAAAASRRYELAHPEKVKEAQRQKYLKNRVVRLEKAALYREANLGKIKAYLKAYNQTPDGKTARANAEHRRRASKQNCTSVATSKEVDEILAGAVSCFYCRTTFTERPTLDHYIPFCRGGMHIAWNLVAACAPCNSSKGRSFAHEFAARKNFVMHNMEVA